MSLSDSQLDDLDMEHEDHLDRIVNPERRFVFAACEVRGPNLLVARRCEVCGAWAVNDPDDDLHRVMGRLPETCRREHGNSTIEVRLVVRNA